MRDARQGFDMGRGKYHERGWYPVQDIPHACTEYGGWEAELGQQLLNWKRDPMAARRGRTEHVVGSGGRRRHGKDATNRRAGNCISEKEFTKVPNCIVVIGTRVVCRERIVVERLGVGIPCDKRRRDATWPLSRRHLLARAVSTKDADKLDCNIWPWHQNGLPVGPLTQLRGREADRGGQVRLSLRLRTPAG